MLDGSVGAIGRPSSSALSGLCSTVSPLGPTTGARISSGTSPGASRRVDVARFWFLGADFDLPTSDIARLFPGNRARGVPVRSRVGTRAVPLRWEGRPDLNGAWR